MGLRFVLTLQVLAFTVLAPHSLQAESELADLSAIEKAFQELAQKVSPSVVAIEARITQKSNDSALQADRSSKPMIGSGMIMTADGLILTNDHVIRYGDQIYVTLHNGKRYQAAVVGRDSRSDIAVIKIDQTDLTPARYDDRPSVHVGQFALAMGNPFGLGRDGHMSLTYGIVSALDKSLPALEEEGTRYYGNLIQTTADINPGNSGGPLFNIRGQVIGINTAIETKSGVSEGFGFAIPLNERTLQIAERLSQGQEVEYGFLGVNIAWAEENIRRQVSDANLWGVVVTDVLDGTPADQAEIQLNDLIVEYAQTPVRSPDQLIRLVGSTPVGESVPILIYRNSKPMTLEVVIAKREAILTGSR